VRLSKPLCSTSRVSPYLSVSRAGGGLVAPSGGRKVVAASVRRAQEQGFGDELDPEHTAAAIALLFENFTTVFVGTSGLGLEISDEDAVATLSRIWKKTLYGF